MPDWDAAGLAALIVAASTLATVFTTLAAKWLEERRQRTIQTAEVGIKVEEVEHLSIERAAEILERQVSRMEAYADKEREKRIWAEEQLEAARRECPVGMNNCPIKRAAERKGETP